MRFVFILLVLSGLAGCVNTQYQVNRFHTNWDDPAVAQKKVSVKYDNFKQLIRFEGPDISPSLDRVFIRAWKSYGAEHVNYQIYINNYYEGEWRFYNEAYDLTGSRLEFVGIARDVVDCKNMSCSHREHVAINVDAKYLSGFIETGLDIKVYGKAGQASFHIPGGYIKGFLNRVDLLDEDIKLEIQSFESALKQIEIDMGKESQAYKDLYTQYEAALKRL